MQFALAARCAHCSRPLHRPAAHSLLANQYWTRYGPSQDLIREYSTIRRSGKPRRYAQQLDGRVPYEPQSTRPPTKPPPPPPRSSPSPSSPTSPSDPEPSPSPEPTSAQPTVPTGFNDTDTPAPHSRTTTPFDFADVRERKVLNGQAAPQPALIIGTEHATALTAALERKETRDPVAVFGMIAGWMLRHHARKLGYQVYPDGFVRVDDVLRYSAFHLYTVEKFAQMIQADPKARFELTQMPDFVDGVLKEVWWIRAKRMHSIPGVSPHCKRILRVGKYRYMEYRTRPENWGYILKYGIPESADCLIRLHNPFSKNLFTQSIPEDKKVLCLTIDVEAATNMGVTFFHDNDVDIVAVAARDKRAIPLEACRSAVIMEFSKQVLYSPGTGMLARDEESRTKENRTEESRSEESRSGAASSS